MMKILAGQCKKQSQEVKKIKKIIPIVLEMVRICGDAIGNYKFGGYALAHCQVDHTDPLRFFVMKNGLVIINPKIVHGSEESDFTHYEGCLSFPYRPEKKVKRYETLDIEYTGLDGKQVKERLTGLVACIFQHEIDHFNGKAIY